MSWRSAICMLCAWNFLGAMAQSVSSCGAAGDHLKDVKITLSPDPIKKGTPWSLSLSGTMDEVLSGGNVNADLSIKALDVINKAVKVTSPFSVSPGLQAGAQSLTIGPLTLPSLPGSVVASGTIKITNAKNEPVACVKLDINVPAESSDEATEEAAASHEAEVTTPGATVCSQPSDHLKNLAVSSSAGKTTVTGTLDELVSKTALNLALKLKIGWLTHAINMAIPIVYTPGLPKGALQLTVGPKANLEVEEPEIDVSVSGTVKLDDGNAQEIMCLDVSSTDAATGVITI